MTFSLTERAQRLADQSNVEPNLILEIDGIPYVFGAIGIDKTFVYGDNANYGDAGLFYGGTVQQENSRDWISLQGSTTSISQQLNQDKDGTSSVSSIKIRIIDKDAFLSGLFAPGQTVPDLLGREASVYLGFIGGAHPDDSIKIFQGTVAGYDFGSGFCVVKVSHPQELKKAKLFLSVNDQLTSSIGAGDTTINVASTDGVLTEGDSLETYIRIDDEIIRYTGFTPTSFTGCTRGQLGTTAVPHDGDADFNTVYRLTGETIQLALKLYLSDGNQSDFVSGIEVDNILQITPLNIVNRAIGLPEDVETLYNVQIGDQITITGSAIPANNITATVSSFGVVDGFRYVLIDQDLTIEVDSPATVSFKSQYNVMTTGLGLKPNQVDIAQHQDIESFFLGQLPDYDFRIEEEVVANEFFDKQIYFPSGLYSLPRKGRISCNITIPPLAQVETKVLNSDNVINPDKIVIKRSTNKNFYNTVVYKYSKDIIAGKYLAGDVRASATSLERIPVGNKPLTIESDGLRRNAVTDLLITNNSRRLLDRYQFGAEFLECEVFYKTGFNLEVGDSVIFGDSGLQIHDSKFGDRRFRERIMEVTNKRLDFKNGRIKLELTDTAFRVDGRYTVIGPSSLIDAGSTTTRIRIKQSFGTQDFEIESNKWTQYVTQTVRVRSDDYTFDELVTLTGIDPVDNTILTVDPALSLVPGEDYIIEQPAYDDTGAETNSFWKTLHASVGPTLAVDSGASDFVFDVAGADIGKVTEQSILLVHNADFSIVSPEVTIESIIGNTITVNDSLGFTPDNTFTVDLVGFLDDGFPYRYL